MPSGEPRQTTKWLDGLAKTISGALEPRGWAKDQASFDSANQDFMDKAEKVLTGILGSEPGSKHGPSPGLAILAGPAKYAIQRASKPLGKYLQGRPETFYTHFEGPASIPLSSLNFGRDMETVGATKRMDEPRARFLTGFHQIMEGSGAIPTVQNVKSGSLERGTAKSLYQPLERPLREGDVEIVLSKRHDPNVFRSQVADNVRAKIPDANEVAWTREGLINPGPSSKPKHVLKEQKETAIHEGLHGAWLAKTGGREGNPPFDWSKRPELFRFIVEANKRAGIDPLELLASLGSMTPNHRYLDAAAKNAAAKRKPR